MSKQKYINQLKVGNLIEEIFCIKTVREGITKAGAPFLSLILMDKSGEIAAPIWDGVEDVKKIVSVGEMVLCRGMVAPYNGQKQIKIETISPARDQDVDITDFIDETRANRTTMARELQQIINQTAEPWRNLLFSFFGEDQQLWREFQNSPAAKKAHHAYAGGLLEHSLSVSKVCIALANHYPGIDHSLLIAGALLHDIGKLKEMKFCGAAIKYTTAGRLKGHLLIGCEMIAAAAQTIKDFPAEKLQQLEHLILSHHGKYEFGSPVLPITPEAFLLSIADDTDAKMNMIETLRFQLETCEFEFSEYQHLLERFLYLRGYNATERAQIEGKPSQNRKKTIKKDAQTEKKTPPQLEKQSLAQPQITSAEKELDENQSKDESKQLSMF